MSAITDFSLSVREGKAPNRLPYNPYHVEKEWSALAGDDLNFAFHMASAEGEFKGVPGTYTITLKTLTERDGECAYNVYVNDIPAGLCQKNPPTNEFCAPAMLKWSGVKIPANAIIRVESNSYSNLRRPEMNFFEYARGRWTGITFTPESQRDDISSEIIDASIFELSTNVGSSQIKPVIKYDIPAQTYYLVSSGNELNNNKDSFGYLYKKTAGDFVLEAGVKLINVSGSKSSFAGIMVRQSTTPDAPFVSCLIQGEGLVKLKYRAVTGGPIKELIFDITEAEIIELEKKGETYTVSAAKFGGTFERKNVQIPGLKAYPVTGFFVGSGSEKEKEAAAFSYIRFSDL